jgi:anaerobic selenocysteine-containing dehydrogenase
MTMPGCRSQGSTPLLKSPVEGAGRWGRTQCPYCGVGCGLLVQIHAGQAVRVAEEVFEEFKRFTQGRLMDITGVSYARLKRGPVQWPCPEPGHPGTRRLYTDRRFSTPDGRARFIVVDHADPVERPSRDYPLVLTTGRVKNQWHTMTRTGKVENLLKSCREPFVELHPRDATPCSIQDGDFVELTSRRGKLVAQARVTTEIAPGTCFAPFHWGRSAGFYKCANNLTLDACDPVSKEPELKAAAVRVKKLEGPQID